MKENKIEVAKNLVIFSTLNQMTNYRVIKKMNPSKIFCLIDEFKNKENIKPELWYKNLNEILNIKINDVRIEEGDRFEFGSFEKTLKNQIIEYVGNEAICWHITGGQRLYALLIQDFVRKNNRKTDTILYSDGNTELYYEISKKNDETITTKAMECTLKNLKFKDAFKLMGIEVKDQLDSTLKLKENGISKIEDFQNEIKFYNSLYDKLYKQIVDGNEKKIIINDKEGTFLELLVESNSYKDESERKKFLKELFSENDYDYSIFESNEFEKSYPAGYIFEKLVGYKIYECIKDNPKILGMEMSLKTSKETNNIRDELDIVLLTNTGRIINFECKSGHMSGDNAKSHYFTTYELSGVFGLPVFLTPLYCGQSCGKNLKHLEEARSAAKKAGLTTIHFDKIKEELKKIL